MRPRMFVIAVGVLLLLVGVFVGFSSVSVDRVAGAPVDCGSAFSPRDVFEVDFGSSLRAKTPAAQCDDQLSSKRTVSLVILGVGLLTIIGGAVVRTGESLSELENRARLAG